MNAIRGSAVCLAFGMGAFAAQLDFPELQNVSPFSRSWRAGIRDSRDGMDCWVARRLE
jgi:hypothetical protein